MTSLTAYITILLLSLNLITAKPVDFSLASRISSRQQTLFDCLSAHGVPTRLTSSPDWSSLTAPFNLRLSYVPAAVTLPTTTQHVSDSVTCAAAAGVKVQAKSGGHSYASFSSGGKDGSLIVDLQNFNSITVDGSSFIAAVGGGVRLGNLALAIYSQGGRALPHGTCPGVGVGGHFTHGGYGHDSRLWGLALDTIVALDVVLANGSLVHATSDSYPDVYFAMRGAADSFGIVTTFYLQTLPAPSSVINFAVAIPNVLSSAATAASAFLKLQNFVLTSQYVNRNISFGIYTDGHGFTLGGWYFGDQAFFTNTVLPAMLDGFPATEPPTINALGWLDSLVHLAGGGSLAEPLTGYKKHDTFYAKSIVTHTSKPLTQAALESFFGYTINQGRSAPGLWFSIINLYGGLDSQINAKAVDSSAYSDRDALWVFQNYGYTSSSQPPYDPAITNFIDGMNNALTSAQPDGNFGAYLNYVDPDLTASQAADLYYGQSLYSRLAQIKRDVDPNAVFWNPQAIVGAGSGPSSSTSTTVSTFSKRSTSPSSKIATSTSSNTSKKLTKSSSKKISFTTSTTSTSSSSSTPTSSPGLPISTDATCGSSKGTTCQGSAFGNCCSSAGWCGNDAPWCGTGCQPGYGRCT